MPASAPASVGDAALVSAQEALHDAQLVERVRDGDDEAYGDLVTRYMRRAFTIAYRVLEDRADAEDVVQDSFIRALERLDTLQRGRPFRPWFYRIVMNQSLNFRRARAVRRVEEIPYDAPATTTSPALAAERSLLRDRLTLALDTLPATQRTIIELVDLEQFTSAEVAAMLDMPDGTVRWHLHQARRALRALLLPMKEES